MLKLVFPVSSIGQACLYVFICKFRKVVKDFIMGHSGGQPPQNIKNGNPGVSDTGFAKSLVWVSFDYISVINHAFCLLCKYSK